jgi:P4 family phage/plasmid primase-like protien
MTTPLKQYIDGCRWLAADWNLTGFGDKTWQGKFRVPDEDYEEFLDLVHTHIFTDGHACALVERHLAQSPILIDLDFKYPSGGPLRRRFTMDQIHEFVEEYAVAFNKFFVPAEPLEFFVMLKPAPEAEADHHKDGVHIVCPNITLTRDIQCALRGYMLQQGAIERIFKDTGTVSDAKDIFDLSVIRPNSPNNWFLYGAGKANKSFYKLERVFQLVEDGLESLDISGWTPAALIKKLSLRLDHQVATELVMREGTDWPQLLQRYGSGKSWAKTKTPTLTSQSQVGGALPPLSLDAVETEMVQISGMSVRSEPPANEIKLAYRLVEECFNPERRVGSYHEWVRTGLLLHNIANTEESFKAWVSLSKKVAKYKGDSEASYRTKWLQLPSEAAALQRGVRPLSIATVHHYAKEDNSEKYTKIMDRAHIDFAIMNCSGTHVGVADLILDMYQYEFRCTPLKKGATAASMDWYQYAGHTWKNLKSAMRLRERLSTQVRDQYLKAGRDIRDKMMQATDQEDRDRHEEKLKKLNKLESSLQTSGFKDCVMKEITEKFYDEDFLQHMNQNPTTVGFSNGVLELRHAGDDGQPHVHFRPGQPDDCISFQMGRGMVGLDAIPFLEGPLAYNPGAQGQPLEYLEIMSFFKKIYPDPVLREYCLTLYAACLEGANREQKFYILTGVGSNGKSKIVELLSKTFGEYQESMGTTAITRKRPDSGAANPDLVVLKCKRFVSMSEPDEGEKINTASMKQLSGEDVVKARALFQDQDQFVIMARIFMLCNDLPPVSSTDGGTWRRLRVIPHVARFIDVEATPDPANHVYHKDLMLDGKIAKWRPYFASILVWYYENRYLRGGLKEPEQVASASKKYKEENDAFAAFCQDCLIKEAGAELRANDLLLRYKEWNKYNPGKKVMPKPALLQKMSDTYGSIEGGKVFVGVRIVEEGEDISGNYI